MKTLPAGTTEQIVKKTRTGKTEQIFDLKEALAFANGIINTVSQPLVVLYPKLTIHSVNKEFYKTFKTAPKETIGRHLYNLGDGQWNIPLLKKMLERTMTSKKSFRNFEVQHSFETIGEKIMLLNARKIDVNHANNEMTLLAIEDITDRRALEKRAANEQYTLAANNQLLLLVKQRDEFIYLTSHELKTPVTILKVFVELLQEKLKEAAESDAVLMLKKMNEQIDKLTRRITDLLDAAKIANGKLHYNLTHFNLNELIKEVVNEMQLTTRQHTIEVNLASTVTVFADKARIEQVIINLLSNAIKYSPKAKKIIVSTYKDQDYIVLSIKDFGIGISADKQNRLFEKFFRVGGQTEDTFPGLGLGLFLSAQIIKRHKGSIYLESNIGKGVTFSFTLPFIDKPLSQGIIKEKESAILVS